MNDEHKIEARENHTARKHKAKHCELPTLLLVFFFFVRPNHNGRGTSNSKLTQTR